MLTKGECDFINHFVRQSCMYWIIPSDWDTDLNIARPTKSKWKIIFCTLNIIVALVILAFSVSTLHISISEYGETHCLDGLVIHSILITFNFVLTFLEITLNLYVRDLLWLLNNTVKFNQEFGLAELRTRFLDSNNREKYIRAFQWLVNFGIVPKVATFLILREHHGNIYSALASGYKTWPTFFIFFVFEYWSAFMELRLTFTMLYLVSVTYMCSANFWLRFDWPRDTFTRPSIAYNSIYILNTVFNNTMSRLYIPMGKLIAIMLSMICMCIVIYLRSQVHPMIPILNVCIILTAYIFLSAGSILMSAVYKQSIEMKLKLTRSNVMRIQDSKERKINSMVLYSMAPIKCCVGNLYFMEKKAKGTLVDWLVQGTMFLLLTFRK